MAGRAVIQRFGLTRSMDTSRGAMTRFFSDKGRVLSEEERAKESVYIQKMERERVEKLKKKLEKELAEKEKEVADKKPEGSHTN